MENIIHVLNGDALKERLPHSIHGIIVVARECLLDGPVDGSNLQEFYATREQFLKTTYPDIEINYSKDVVSEFNKLLHTDTSNSLNLWFEDDLFCQVNLWFVCWLITNHSEIIEVYLVRSETNLKYGFGGLSEEGLEQAYDKRILLSEKEINIFASLWVHYQKEEHDLVMETAKPLYIKFPVLRETIQANLDRFPKNNTLSRPKKTLKVIMDEIGSKKFGPVFQEFHNREAIYGFGDIQVKRMFDELKNRM